MKFQTVGNYLRPPGAVKLLRGMKEGTVVYHMYLPGNFEQCADDA